MAPRVLLLLKVLLPPSLQALDGAAHATRRLVPTKLRAMPSRIDEPQLPRALLELPRDLILPRLVHPSTRELTL